MGYVVAGYTVVLGILFLYAVQLVWRRRRLGREAAALEEHRDGPGHGVGAGGGSVRR